MKPWLLLFYLVWNGGVSLALGYYIVQTYIWKRKYLALRNAPMLREIERQLQEEKSK